MRKIKGIVWAAPVIIFSTMALSQQLSPDGIIQMHLATTADEIIYKSLDINVASALVTNAQTNVMLVDFCTKIGSYPEGHSRVVEAYWRARMVVFSRSMSDMNYEIARGRAPEVAEFEANSDLYHPVNTRCSSAYFEAMYWVNSMGVDMTGSMN